MTRQTPERFRLSLNPRPVARTGFVSVPGTNASGKKFNILQSAVTFYVYMPPREMDDFGRENVHTISFITTAAVPLKETEMEGEQKKRLSA
jgi:hypothetical protein